MALGDILGGIGSLVGAAGDIYSAFNPPKAQGGSAKPYTGLISTPAFSFGGGSLTRRNSDFLTGQRRVRDLVGAQLNRVRPGFGDLTKSGVNAIRQRAAEASGNLRAQLGRRGLLGASFADDALNRVGIEYQQAENEFRTQAFLQEMQATNELIDRESVSLLTQAQQELQELGIATSFLNSVNQVAVTQKEIDKILAQEKLQAKFNEPSAARGPVGGKPPPGSGGPMPMPAPGTAPAPSTFGTPPKTGYRVRAGKGGFSGGFRRA